MLSLEDLPLDIRDRLLVYMPDFLSLRCAVLSSGYLLEAYKARKKSIFRSVLENEAGPVLPYATALIRVRAAIGKNDSEQIFSKLNNPESDCWRDIQAREAFELTRVASIVNRLEVHFSMRYKDRTATKCTFEDAESNRFRKTAYLLWILGSLANDRFSRVKPRLGFLSTLSDGELCAIEEMMRFLDELHLGSLGIRDLRPGSTRPTSYLLDNILYIFDGYGSNQGPWPNHWVPGASFGGNLGVSTAFETLWKDRKVSQLFEGKYNRQSILSRARVESIQACQKCGAQQENILFSENNWNWVQTRIRLLEFRHLFPGKLSMNEQIMNHFFEYMNNNQIAPMLYDMYACQNDPGSGWNKGDWICLDCLKTFISENILSWLVRQLVQDGHQFEENCWYGYNCRTQVHRWEHARKLNHLCEPTNRDNSNGQN